MAEMLAGLPVELDQIMTGASFARYLRGRYGPEVVFDASIAHIPW